MDIPKPTPIEPQSRPRIIPTRQDIPKPTPIPDPKPHAPGQPHQPQVKTMANEKVDNSKTISDFALDASGGFACGVYDLDANAGNFLEELTAGGLSVDQATQVIQALKNTSLKYIDPHDGDEQGEDTEGWRDEIRSQCLSHIPDAISSVVHPGQVLSFQSFSF